MLCKPFVKKLSGLIMAKNIAKESFKAISEVIPSEKVYIIRPYVVLRGQRNGFMWSKAVKGGFRSFLSMHVKTITAKNSGK